MIKLGTYDNDRFVIIKYWGKIEREYMFSFMEYIFQNSNKKVLEKALIDFRDAEMDFKIDDLYEMMRMRKGKYGEGFAHALKSVYLVNEARETAFATLYAKGLPADIVKIQVCSTVEYAIRLLDLNLSVRELEDRIASLSTAFPE